MNAQSAMSTETNRFNVNQQNMGNKQCLVRFILLGLFYLSVNMSRVERSSESVSRLSRVPPEVTV